MAAFESARSFSKARRSGFGKPEDDKGLADGIGRRLIRLQSMRV